MSQAYRVLNPARDYLYARENPAQNRQNVDLAIHLDSSVVSGTDTVRYNYRIARINPANAFSNCYFSYRDTSWLGVQYIEQPGNRFVFFNRGMDSIFIRPGVANWRLYEFSSGDYIVASLSGTMWDTIPGGMDSVRVFTLNAFTAGGSSLASPWNGFQLKISKTLGLLQGFNFYHFPDTLPDFQKHLNLAGLTQPTVGAPFLSSEGIWDIQVGDTLQFEFEKTDIQSSEVKKTQKIILNRWENPSIQTVFWEVDRSYYTYFTDWSGNPVIFTGRDTLTESQDLSLPEYPGALPYASGGGATQLADPVEFPAQYTSGAYNGRFIRQHSPYNTLDSVQSCYDQIPILSWTETFGVEGLGLGFYEKSLVPQAYHIWRNLPTWFSKNGETWGNKVDFSQLLTGIEAQNQATEFSVYPNPVEESCRILLPGQEPGKVQLFDVSGRKLLEEEIQAGVPLEIGREVFPCAGVYIIKVSAASLIPGTKQIVVR